MAFSMIRRVKSWAETNSKVCVQIPYELDIVKTAISRGLTLICWFKFLINSPYRICRLTNLWFVYSQLQTHLIMETAHWQRQSIIIIRMNCCWCVAAPRWYEHWQRCFQLFFQILYEVNLNGICHFSKILGRFVACLFTVVYEYNRILNENIILHWMRPSLPMFRRYHQNATKSSQYFESDKLFRNETSAGWTWMLSLSSGQPLKHAEFCFNNNKRATNGVNGLPLRAINNCILFKNQYHVCFQIQPQLVYQCTMYRLSSRPPYFFL